MNKQDFRETLAVHVTAKIKAEGLSYRVVSEELGSASANWIFRAATASREEDSCGISVSQQLIDVLNWLQLEPRDFGCVHSNGYVGPGHVTRTIYALMDYDEKQRETIASTMASLMRSLRG